MENPARQKDKRFGWIISIVVHGMVVCLFLLINAWKAPNPPHPEYGVELNIGIEQEGFGDDQPLTPSAEQSQPEEVELQPQEVQPEPEPVEDQATEEDIPDSKQEDSPVKAKPEEKPKPVDPVKETKKEEVKPTPPVETKPKVEEKKPDAKAMYPGGASQGTKQGQTGDAGNPQGTVEGKALYGTQGGGDGGPTLEISGWRWVSEPKVPDKSSENGRIVFEIKVDDNGDIIAVRTLEKTVSPAVEQIYRKEVEKLSFRPTLENSNPSPLSTGKITFIIRSN